MKATQFGVCATLAVGVAAGFVLAKATGEVAGTAHAADTPTPSAHAANYSRTGAFENRSVYYPGTEALQPDEMRVIACGSGMPVPSLNQGAACFLVELGNGDKFIFDMGTGSTRNA